MSKESEAFERIKHDGDIEGNELYHWMSYNDIVIVENGLKENELLKEIIKSLFDRGCPLHQYIDKDFGLTIEVDNECSHMRLGEFKGVDLDKKLKEVLE